MQLNEVTITLRDTPAGGVAVHSSFRPAIGAPCSPAQAAALEIVNRTSREWGLPSARPKEREVFENSMESPEGGLLSSLPHDA